MPGRHDARRVHVEAPASGLRNRKKLIQCKPQVGRAVDGLRIMRGVLQARRQGEGAARPQAAVTAHMLHMQARPPMARQVRAQVAVAPTRTAQPMREQHQRHGPRARFGQVDANGNRSTPRLITPVGLHEFHAIQPLKGSVGSRPPVIIQRTGAGLATWRR